MTDYYYGTGVFGKSLTPKQKAYQEAFSDPRVSAIAGRIVRNSNIKGIDSRWKSINKKGN